MGNCVREASVETARLDNFVDGAFAFTVTLLVISGSSFPKDVPSLLRALDGVPAFACAFAQLAWFWHGHVRWRDSARLADKTSLLLSLLLVFFALIFVYPLHMVYASFFNSISGGHLSSNFVIKVDAAHTYSFRALFVVFGIAFACMSATLAALCRHGARATHLTVAERISLRVSATGWGYSASVGLLSAVLAVLLPAQGPYLSLAGFCYALHVFLGPVLRSQRRRLEKAQVALN